jgi:hypothetical protein
MSFQYTRLTDPMYLTGSVTPVYVNQSGTKTFVSGFILFNGNTASETTNLYLVPNVGFQIAGAGSVHRWWGNSIAAAETVFIDLQSPIILDKANDTIQGSVNSVNNRVSITILGNKDVP